MPITGLAVAAGLGLVKSEAVDKPKAERERTLAAATQRWSPWTGNKAQPIQEADPFGSMLKYGATGAAIGGNYANGKSAQSVAPAPGSGGLGGMNYNQSPQDFWGLGQSGWIK